MTHDKLVKQCLPTEEACVALLESWRWPKGTVCPYCDGTTARLHPSVQGRARRWACSSCNRNFTVMVGTFLHHSHTSIRVWFAAIALYGNNVMPPTRVLARKLRVMPSTARSLSAKIKNAIKRGDPLMLRSLNFVRGING